VTEQHGYSIFGREWEREKKSVILSAATLTNLTEAVYQKRVTAHTSVPLLSLSLSLCSLSWEQFFSCRRARSGCWRMFAVNRTFTISRTITPSIQKEEYWDAAKPGMVFFVLCELWLRKTRQTQYVVWVVLSVLCETSAEYPVEDRG